MIILNTADICEAFVAVFHLSYGKKLSFADRWILELLANYDHIILLCL